VRIAHVHGKLWHSHWTDGAHQGDVRAGPHAVHNNIPRIHVRHSLPHLHERRTAGICARHDIVRSATAGLALVSGQLLARRNHGIVHRHESDGHDAETHLGNLHSDAGNVHLHMYRLDDTQLMNARVAVMVVSST